MGVVDVSENWYCSTCLITRGVVDDLHNRGELVRTGIVVPVS